MKTLREIFASSKKTTAFAALLAFAIAPAFAATYDLNGVSITATGATDTWVSGDLVLTYADTATPGTLTLPGPAKVSLLVVGGGGAGGSGKGSSNNRGVGGGGGAGGFIGIDSTILQGGDYSIDVGAGGIAGTDGSGAVGGDGGSSRVLMASTLLVYAGGGGGGGVEGVGRDGCTTNLVATLGKAGGSGGGGSATYASKITTSHEGGSGADGGFAGGAGSHGRTAGGGGGASQKGYDSSGADTGTNGGSGMPSSITGTSVTYAGGGGSGVRYDKGGQGGAGGGGTGANGESDRGEAGDPNTGGGGGGGSLVLAGGNGGSGVVIIRISEALDGDLTVPESKTLTYNGENQIAVRDSFAYHFEAGSVTNATNAGVYDFTVTPNSGFKWSDGTDHSTNVVWKIVAKEVAAPTAIVGAEYGGTNIICYTESDYYSFVADENSKTNAVNAGNYSYTVSLNNPAGFTNCVWSGKTGAEAVADHTVEWAISPLGVDKPSAPSGLMYDGENHIAFDASEAYSFTSGSFTNATDAGSYNYEIALNNPAGVTNYVWSTLPPDSDNVAGTWTIAQSTNWCTVAMDGWKIGETAADPVWAALWSDSATVEIKYAKSLTAAAGDWTSEKPDEAGTWYVKVTIPETDNWAGAEATDEFVLWDSPDQVFRNSLTFTVDGKYVHKPVAVWNAGEFADDASKHGGYAITLNGGNTINTAGNIVIGDTATKGVTISLPSGSYTNASILVKYRAPSGGAPAENSVLAGVLATDKHPIGAFCRTAGGSSIEGYWLDGTTVKTGYSFKTPPPAAENGSGYFLFCYQSDAVGYPNNGTAFYIGDTVESLSGGNKGALQWGGKTINEVSVGGPVAEGDAVPWKGLEIESITLLVGEWLKPEDILTNLQVPVRISEDADKGLLYSELGGDGKSLAFVGEDGKLLSYDIDHWDVRGESVVWVNLPNASFVDKFTMFWNLQDGQIAPGPDSKNVWADYIGVWHMNDGSDSSPNGFDGTTNGYASISAGLTGQAMSQSSKRGPFITVPQSEVMDNWTNSGFLASMWFKPNSGDTYKAFLLGRRATSGAAGVSAVNCGYGVQINESSLNASGGKTGLVMYNGETGSGKYKLQNVAGLDAGKWSRLDFLYTPTKYEWWVDGEKQGEATAASWTAITMLNPVDPLGFAIGGAPGTIETSVNGAIDEFRLRAGVSDATHLAAEYSAVASDTFLGRSAVVRDGKKVNYWVVDPSVTPSNWPKGENPADDAVSNGKLAYDTPVTNWIYEVNAPGNVYSKISEIPSESAGLFRAVFSIVDTNTYEALSREVQFRINTPSPYGGIQGNGGDSGRVLLMNNDETKKNAILYQGYSDTEAVSTTSPTFWQIEDEPGFTDSTYNMKAGQISSLWTANYGMRLWRLDNCRHGNTYTKGDSANYSSTNTSNLKDKQNYLPFSSMSRAIDQSTDDDPEEAIRSTVGQVVMRNIEGATVYSSCFTNGVGTIYFDAVNGWTDGASETGDNYKIVVEVATNAMVGTVSKIPTDENAVEYIENIDGTITTNLYGHLEGQWHAVDVVPYIRDNTDDFVKLAPTNLLALAVKTPKTTKNFYRVVVPFTEEVNSEYYKAPALRFRIRRVTYVSTMKPDVMGMILLDNIIVSYPPMQADLETAGFYDPGDATKRGKTMMGYELSTSTPFPAIGDATLKGRAKANYYVNDGKPDADTATFVESAQMWYRWRYLNQTFDQWKYVDLDPLAPGGLESNDSLELPAYEGDVEYYYVAQLQAPFYKYVDYTGLDLGVPGWSEEVTEVTNRLGSAAYMPSAGTDWFFRLRKGTCDWEGVSVVQIVQDGAVTNEYPMALVEDDMWRTLIMIPTNAEGVCKMFFKGTNKQSGSPWVLDVNETLWGVADGSDAAFTPPGNGLLNEGGAPLQFEFDHDANYLEVKVSTRFLTWSVARAEYQNFNHWNDAHTGLGDSPLFKASFTETNGVDDVLMRTGRLADEIGLWKMFMPTNFDDWAETFHMVDYTASGFPKNVFYQDHLTPHGWNGYNLTFVSTTLTSNSDSDQQKYSGMAAKLLGQGKGSLVFTKSNCPQGLDKVTFRARLGQSMTFDGISWHPDALSKKDYVFFAPATMSRKADSKNEDILPEDMAVGAAVSVVGYYRPSKGCYEFRVERHYKGPNIRLSLYKWRVGDSGVIESVCLCAQDFGISGRMWSSDSTASDENRLYYGMFISLENTSSGTKIICGLSEDAQKVVNTNPVSDFSGKKFRGLVYTDNSSPFTRGAYGVMSADCAAEYMAPVCYNTFFSGSIDTEPKDTSPTAGGRYFDPSKNTLSFDVPSDDENLRKSIRDDEWELVSGHCDLYKNPSNDAWTGLKTPVNLNQTVDLWLMSRSAEGADWVKYWSQPVSSYGFADFEVPLHLTGTWDLKLTSGSKSTDVALYDVKQYQWQAPDNEGILSASDKFTFTQGVVETNTTLKAKQVTLQPSRGVATKAMSLRSPATLAGLGRVAFAYTGVDTNAEIWVQVATNAVNNLTGATGYNNSVESVDLEDIRSGVASEPIGTWITVAKYTYGDLGFAGSKSLYLGWHNDATDTVRGIFRLFVPTSVVSSAIIAATNDTKNLAYGRITVTGMTVSDEPALSDRAWRGWNIRTIGEASDEEGRMAIYDTTMLGEDGTGLDCGLNNTLEESALADIDPLPVQPVPYPTIYSPTFKGYGSNRGIGAVTFSARLYLPNDGRETKNGGVVTLYGSKSSIGESWEKIESIKVVGSTFADYSWTASNQTYAAVKLEVSTNDREFDRVILDEVTISEKVSPTLSFVYAIPFRQNLMSTEPIEDIASPDEQPLLGESWGVQAKLALRQLADDIDVERGIVVTLSYFHSVSIAGGLPSVWGWGNWESLAEQAGTSDIPLVQVGDAADLIFRSVGDAPESLVKPVSESGSVVQYQLKAHFYGRDGTEYTQVVDNWERPDWYYPIDHNKAAGATDPQDPNFSPYTILDSVSPGRAWINEVNWNDGPEANVSKQQFVEICVPAGIDMTGWYLQLNDGTKTPWMMTYFGKGGLDAITYPSDTGTNGYEFIVVQSPATSMENGGLRYTDTGDVIAKAGVWGTQGVAGSAPGGELNYGVPFQFELVRPSGVVEHQFVLEGTNMWAGTTEEHWASGTALKEKLDAADGSPLRFFGGQETALRNGGVPYGYDGRVLGAIGVVGEADNPGVTNTWTSGLKFTPGQLNEGQTIPEGWNLLPNGTNAWVYLTVVGAHLHQDVDGDTAASTMIVVPQGVATNVTYTADPWFETAYIDHDGVVTEHHKPATWVYAFTPTQQTVRINAHEGPLKDLVDDFGLVDGNPYTPAVLNWLLTKYPGKSPADIVLAKYKGLDEADSPVPLTLTEMYWLDITPFGAADEWWLRGNFVANVDGGTLSTTNRNVTRGSTSFVLTNRLVTVKLYITNTVDNVTYPPYAPSYLQGLANERSDTFTGNWTSETFQVCGLLDNGLSLNKGFLPFHSFVFNGNSFYPKGDPREFESTIEITDPFSRDSVGYGYGWGDYPNTTSTLWRWQITSTNTLPMTVERLGKDHTFH